jgi:hypothetical protein
MASPARRVKHAHRSVFPLPAWGLVLGSPCVQATFLFLLLQVCPAGDLAAGKPVTGTASIRGNPQVVTDGYLPDEGTFWESPLAVVLPDDQANVTVDMGVPTPVRAFVLQGDNNDVYTVDGSLDATNWHELWAAPPKPVGHGLRTRFIDLNTQQTVRYLRVHGSGGDGFFSLSELRVYCQLPTPWPPLIKEPPKPTGWAAFSNDDMVAVKGVTALLGALVLLWGLLVRRAGRPHMHKRARDISLAALGIFSFFCWWNLGKFHFDNFLHIWEHYHYYMGSKYFRELGYTRLYQCTGVAEIEQGFRDRVAKRQMRNLATNHLESSDEIVRDPTICTSHFKSPERWESFKHDMSWFRSKVSLDTWNNSQKDHGYNATPVWGIVGTILSNMGPASDDQINLLAALDPLLLITMWGVCLWGFGWRPTCVALLWWGTNFPARYWWNGGAYLRMDWLAFSMIGLAFMKRNRFALGGASITYGALLRIFPGFMVIAIMLKALMHMVRQRKITLTADHKQFAKGCILALAVLMPVSFAVSGSASSWVHFAENSRKHLSTPLTNNMGLKTVVAYTSAGKASLLRNMTLSDPFEAWKEVRRSAFEHRKWLFAGLVLVFMGLVARASEKLEDWAVLALGVGFVPVIGELTCYYYSILLGLGFLCLVRDWIGVGVAALSALTCAIYGFLPGWDDEKFTWMSLAIVLFVAAAAYYLGKEPAEQSVALSDDSAKRDPPRSVASGSQAPRRADRPAKA